MDSSKKRFRFVELTLASFTFLASTAYANIVPDASAPQNQQPTVSNTANNIPQINIQTPSPQGVSRNTYSQFDVDNRGAILNNARVDVDTQLAGRIAANPSLAAGTAKIILNEVNSSDPSLLRGLLEVAGDRAQVVIANPSGITCNGCGFINAHRATLTTGRPIMDNGNLELYLVRKGIVTIEGAGLNTGEANFTDIIARAVKINAEIHAKDVLVISGTNAVDAAGEIINSKASFDAEPAPELAIDVAALGGMYANAIRLVSTEHGVGVRNAGALGAGVGEFVLTANGMVENIGAGKIDAAKVAIAATTLNNIGAHGVAPTITASTQLDIGAKTINNTEHALIQSKGIGNIGSSLDENNHAVGKADTLNNISAKVDIKGAGAVNVGTLINKDAHFETKEAQVFHNEKVEYQLSGYEHRYNHIPNFFYKKNNPNGRQKGSITTFKTSTTITETQVANAEPAEFLIGGALTLNADVVLNDKGRVIAQGPIEGEIGKLINIEVPGSKVTTNWVDAATRHPDGLLCKTAWGGPTTERFALKPSLFLEHATSNDSLVMISGQAVHLDVAGNVLNSGTIASQSATTLSGETIDNHGGRITGAVVDVHASVDVNNIGGVMQGSKSLHVTAERDINAISELTRNDAANGSNQTISRKSQFLVTDMGGTMNLEAKHDVNFAAAKVKNEGGETFVKAGHDINHGVVTETSTDTVIWDANNYRTASSSNDVGTEIDSLGTVHFDADNDLNFKATHVVSQEGNIMGHAGHAINILAGESSYESEEHRYKEESNALRKKKISEDTQHSETHALSSNLSAVKIDLSAGQTLTINGSNVVSDEETKLSAIEDVVIDDVINESINNHHKAVKKSGVLGEGDLGVMIGHQENTAATQTITTTATGSIVGSINGKVDVTAGGEIYQQGAHFVAPNGDVYFNGQKVSVVDGRETDSFEQALTFKQTGLSVGVTSPVLSAIQTAEQMQDAISDTSDARMQALGGATTALAAKNALDAVAMNPEQLGGVNVSASFGTSQSESHYIRVSDSANPSTITAGGTIDIKAQGAGEESNILLQGAKLKAPVVNLDAENKVLLKSAENKTEAHRTHESSSASFGVSANATGVSATVAGSMAQGVTDTESLAHTNTHIDASVLASVKSGGDTSLSGAVVNAFQFMGKVGGNLLAQSLQDISNYFNKEESASFGASVPIAGGAASASLNLAKTNINSDYASVQEQTGVRAGDGGFQIEVAGHTHLDGSVITSTDDAMKNHKNTFVTSTLSYNDIENTASYDAQSVQVGIGYSPQGNIGTDQQGQVQTGGLQVPGSTLPSIDGFSAPVPIAVHASDSAQSITKSGISGAKIEIQDEQAQQALTGMSVAETLANLNRAVSSEQDTSNALTPIFNEDEIKAGFAIASALTREAGIFLNHRAEEGDENWGPQGTYRQITTALVAGISGNVSAATSEIAKNAIVHYVQQQGAAQIGKLVSEGSLIEGSPEHAALHAMLGCAGAAASSQDCGSGAMGAAASSLLTGLFSYTTPDETNAEREAKRNVINTLVTGIAATQTTGAATATNAATAAVDNNWLATQQEVQFKKEYDEANTDMERLKVALKWKGTSSAQNILTGLGVSHGINTAILNDFDGMRDFLQHPIEGLSGLKAFINNPEVRAKLSDDIRQAFNTNIERIEHALEVGGYEESIQLGEDIGALAWHISSAIVAVEGAAKGGVTLAKAGIKVSAQALENAALQFTKFEPGAIIGFKSADAVNALMDAHEWAPAWKSGTSVAEVTLQPGTKVKMVIDKKTYKAMKAEELDAPPFGGWATLDDVPNQAYARNELAITKEMKPDVAYIMEVEITQPINAHVGIVGSQGIAEGGGNQLHFILDKKDRINSLKINSIWELA